MPIEDLRIRRAEPGDYEAIHQIFCCPRAFAGTLQLPYPSLEAWKQRLAQPSDDHYSLVALVEDRLVGELSVHTFSNKPRRRHAGALGMAVHDDWQGRGIGVALMEAGVTLADRWLNLARLELEVYTDNTPAIRLYERFGFEVEGTLRKYAFRDGLYVDAFAMGRLRPVQEGI